MAFPADPLDVKVELAIGADIHADPGTWSFTDVTTKIREKQKVRIDRGRRNRIGYFPPTRVTATADNTDGNLCRHNPLSTHFGQLKKNTPIRVSVNNGSGYVTRAAAYVSGFPPSWDPSEQDQVVTLHAAGITDRLGRGRVLRSALYRTMSGVAPNDYRPHAYWSMEDGSDATVFASAVANRPPIPVTGSISPGADSTLAGSEALATLDASDVVPFTIPDYVNQGQCVVQWAMKVPSEPSSETTLAEFSGTGGPVNRWRITIAPGSPSTVWIYDLDASGTAVNSTGIALDGSTANNPTETEFFNEWCVWTFAIQQVGSFVDHWFGFSLGPPQGGVSVANAASGTVGKLTSGKLFGGNGVSAGHIGVYVDPGFDPAPSGDAATNIAAMHGYVGEMAHERAERLCREARIPFTTSASTSQAMGPQTTQRLLDLLRECAEADVGLLYEDMNFGLTFVSSSERYNLDPAITLAYDNRQILAPWDPTDDDQDYANEVVATRPDGSPVRVADEDEIDDVGEYGQPFSPNVETDDGAQHVAGFRLNLGLNDELTWPAVRPNLMLGGSLLDDWLATDLGQLLHVTGHPSPLAPDTIRQVIEGYAETLASFDYDVSANLSPASPWDVGVYGVDPGGVVTRYDSDTTESVKALTTSATSLDTAAGDGVAWTTTGGDYPFDLNIGGEQVTATACSNLTLTARTVGTAAHGNNASVTPGLPGSLAEGDVLLCLAAIRNSGTGTVDDESGYTTLLEFGNLKLVGKYSASGQAAPTISFTGGVANADTSAQMMAFAACGLQVHAYATQLNSSAQDIAYPALHVTRDNCLILYLGWKQDDWTSVASPGTEIGEPDTTTGDDQGLVWAYQLQTAATDIAAGSFVVTGGAAAISRGVVIALTTQAQRFTITRSVNGVVKTHAAGSPVALWDTPRYAL